MKRRAPSRYTEQTYSPYKGRLVARGAVLELCEISGPESATTGTTMPVDSTGGSGHSHRRIKGCKVAGTIARLHSCPTSKVARESNVWSKR